MRTLYQALEVHLGGYYAWMEQPLSDREIEDNRLTGDIKQYWLESGGHSGYRNKKWSPIIGQQLDEYKCFLQNERCAQERNDEKTKTKPFI